MSRDTRRPAWMPNAVAALVLALAAGACATAPRTAAPILTYEQKLAQIIRLEDRRILREPPPAPDPAAQRRGGRRAAPPPSPDLIPLLKDPEPRVRWRAALAVGRVGLAAAVAPLSALLKDPDEDVRGIAAFALGLIGNASAAPALTAALSDASHRVRGRAAEALGLIGHAPSAGAIAKMGQEAAKLANLAAIAPDDETWPMEPAVEAFRLASYALVRLKAYDELASVVLEASDRPRTHWWPVAYALQRIDDRRAVPALMALAKGEGRYTRAFAARGLGAAQAAEATDTLVAMVDPATLDPLVAVSAIRALAQIGGEQATDAIVNLIRAPQLDPNVRLEAVVAAGALRATAAADLLMHYSGDSWPAMRAQAMRSLSLVAPDAFLFALSGLDPDRQWSVRAAVATTLASIDPEVAIPRLEPMLDDSDRRVVPAVLSALVDLKAPNAEAILRKHLDDPDVVIRMTAVRELGEMKPADGATLFADAYRRWSADPTYLARAAALAALANYGSAAAPVLKEALADKEWAVRLRAFELLEKIDPAAADPSAIRPVPGPAPAAADSPDVTSPKFSPHLYLETRKGLIEIELAVNEAPLTCHTIMTLARKGFFTGVSFHRVVPNFVVQAGDPRGDGEGGPGFTIRDEINQLPYLRGTVGMALDWRDTGGSQFFITHSPQPHLDGRYTVIGKVVNGMEVVDRLQQWDVIERVRVWDGVRVE